MTQLQAINTMLSYVNEMPLSSLSGNLPIEKLAVNILYEEIYALNKALDTSYTTFDDVGSDKDILKIYMVKRASRSLFNRVIGFEDKGAEQLMYDVVEATSYVIRYMLDNNLNSEERLILNSLAVDSSTIKNILDMKLVTDKISGLIERSKDIMLSIGWNFNSNVMTLQPNNDGYIVIPDNYLSVDAFDEQDDFIISDWKLFNKTEQSYIFDGGVECLVIYDVNLDDLTNSLYNLVFCKAKLSAALALGLDGKTLQALTYELEAAMIEAKSEDAASLDYNLLRDDFVTTLVDRTRL